MASSRLRSGGCVGGDDVHVDAERSPTMPRGSRDAAFAVERIADRQRMDHRAPVAHRMAAPAPSTRSISASSASWPPRSTLAEKALALQPAGGDVDDQRVDRDPRHALGRVDGKPDGLLGRVEIDDDAGLDAARALVAEAEHLDAVRAAAQRLAVIARLQPRDQAADLGRADVEDRQTVPDRRDEASP